MLERNFTTKLFELKTNTLTTIIQAPPTPPRTRGRALAAGTACSSARHGPPKGPAVFFREGPPKATRRAAYLPWSKLSLKYTKMLQDNLQRYKEKFAEKSRDELELAHQYFSKMFDRCLDTAILSHMLHGYEIKIGSCGFVLENGKVYQEFGNFRDETGSGAGAAFCLSSSCPPF